MEGTYSPIVAPGALITQASGINNSGQIVGTFYDGIQQHSYLYSNSIFTAIAVPDSPLTLAFGINDNGQISGSYYGATGGYQGFIASPVPLPTSLLLFASGLLGLSSLTMRRMRRGEKRNVSKTNQ